MIKKIYSPPKIQAKILGKVFLPGIYELNSGDTVKDLLDKAGGSKNDAGLNNLNLEAEVLDGQVIRIE